MRTGDWIALITPALAIGGATFAAAAKLTRLIDAVERLTASMERIAGKVDDHEGRLRDLEATRRRARRRGVPDACP